MSRVIPHLGITASVISPNRADGAVGTPVTTGIQYACIDARKEQ